VISRRTGWHVLEPNSEGGEVANSKKIQVKHKHLRRQKAAKEKVQLYVSGKLQEAGLPALARRFLIQRLRVVKRG
jgi:hypothetical protein